MSFLNLDYRRRIYDDSYRDRQQAEKTAKEFQRRRMQRWFDDIHKDIKPLPESFFAYVKEKTNIEGIQKRVYKASGRDISRAEVNKRRLEAIAYYEEHKEYDKAAELREVHEGQLKLQAGSN